MAERVLPGRQWFRNHAGVMLNDTDEDGMEEWAIVAAYVSGRLVDREAIDNEAAVIELGKQVATNRFDVFAILDAALGVV